MHLQTVYGIPVALMREDYSLLPLPFFWVATRAGCEGLYSFKQSGLIHAATLIFDADIPLMSLRTATSSFLALPL